MLKILCSAILSVAVMGCSSKPPPPPEPKGEYLPVNPTEIKTSDLIL